MYRRGGLKIHTTIDPELQDARRAAIRTALPYSTDPSSAIVAIDPATGYIKAMASSGTYKDRNFNLAAQGRQPGSAFKTFVLVTALGQGVDPNSTTYVSKPLDLNVPGYGPWRSRRTATATAAPWTWSPRRSRPTTRCTRSSTSTSARRTCARPPR